MEIEKYDGTMERKLCTGMIVSTPFLARVASQWTKAGLFHSKYANLIGSWCVSFYNEHRKAPSRHVIDLFQDWANRRSREKPLVESVESLLQGMSGEYQTLRNDLQPQFLLKIADKHFHQIQITKAIDESKELINRGEVDEAAKVISNIRKLNFLGGEGVNLLQDKKALQLAFETPKESLVTYPGPLGKFLGYELERDAFVCFMASNKRGKSWHLLDVAWRAMLQRVRVAYFQVGDLSERQLQQRFAVRAAARPLWAKTINIPREIKVDEHTATVRQKTKIFETGLDWATAWKAYEETAILRVKSKKPYLKYSVHPSYSVNLNGIMSILQTWERQEEWIPDIIVCDYMDILAPIHDKKDTRDQINENWLLARRISQEYHCLFVSATQAKTSSFTNGKYVLSRRDFADDRRKLDHVTAMIGLNQTPAEEEKQVTRWNWVNRRQDEGKGVVYVAGCKDIGNVSMLSSF